MSKFQLPSSTVSTSSTPAVPSTQYSSDFDDDDIDTLPYPGELPRHDFLAPDFDPQTYLSTLRNRHQTLEDLRADLRQRSQLLSKELLDLVNGNYEEFLGLGSDLKGGEERVEGIRVGLLAFQKDIVAIRKGVKERAEEVAPLVKEKKEIRRDVALGRSLLEIDESIGELEENLSIKPAANESEDEDLEDEDDEESEGADVVRLRKLKRHAIQYILIARMMTRVGSDHPFVVSQGSRLEQISKTLLLDLASALRQAKASKDSDSTLAIVKIYGDLGAEEEAVKVLKGS